MESVPYALQAPYALKGGYHRLFQRDDFVCVYCGWNGKIWPNYLYLCRDHLLIKGHPQYDDFRYSVTACRFCNDLFNRTAFDGEAPGELVAQKKQMILQSRQDFRNFWVNNVEPKT